MKSLVKTIAAIGAGIAVGAAVGLLLAPRKGEETRKLIREKGQKLADQMQNQFKEGEKLVTSVKGDVQDAMHGINKKINQLS